MQYTNSQILAAVLNRFIQPVVTQFAQMKLGSMPFVQMIETKLKNTGWVSNNWSLTQEISPMIEPVTGNIVKPFINKYLSNIPDEAIPNVAHAIVDKALEKGSLEILEGKLILDKHDLEELKKLLEYNLPLDKTKEYDVITSPPETKVESTVYNNE